MSDETIRAALRAYLASPTHDNAHIVARHLARASESAAQTRKVIISPGYGGGFGHDIGGAYPEVGKFVVEHPALIAALEETGGDSYNGADEIVYQEVRERFCQRAAQIVAHALTRTDPQDLRVVEVTGAYRITEYDGAEGIRTLESELPSYW